MKGIWENFNKSSPILPLYAITLIVVVIGNSSEVVYLYCVLTAPEQTTALGYLLLPATQMLEVGLTLSASNPIHHPMTMLPNHSMLAQKLSKKTDVV